ncbi:hypothetical protein LB507_010815 [Fusarium sp. FIESC RH6]|nr:hypothetical protein LB507_010815 [Fusarium sp. FIESC RH6]
MPQFRMYGEKLSDSTNSLWAVLRNAVQDPRAGSIIIVLDALDECADFEFVDLMKNIQAQFYGGSLTRGKLRYLLTCRPYDQILTRLQVLLEAFPNIHIPGEEESEAISREVNRVIRRRIDQMAIERQFSAEVKSSLEQRLRDTSHRTYLWVYLVFDYLAEGNFKKTPQGIATAIASLPSSINEAYDKILNKTNKDPMVRKTLCIILAASRPLTISEMNIAVNVDDTMESIEAFDLEDDEQFKRRLRSWCGLFVSIHQGKIYFLHQTAREFLVADLESSTSISSGLRWHHSISTSKAHDVLANICVLYLNLFNSKASPSLDRGAKTGRCANTLSFLNYSATSWMDHFRKADINDAADVLPLVQMICDPGSESFRVWHVRYRKATVLIPETCTDLIMASYIGLPVIVKLLLDKGAEIEARDSYNLEPPLLWAVWAGHEDVAKLLLERGANANTKDNIFNHTPLHAAAELGLNETIKLLLENGADIRATDSCDWTPLLYAVENLNETTVELLLEEGADIDFMTQDGTSSLQLAAETYGITYSAPTIRLLVQNGAFLERDNIHDIYTPLRWASKLGDEATVRLLLDHGACIESRDQEGQTALSLAYREGHDAIVNLLIERGAKFDE